MLNLEMKACTKKTTFLSETAFHNAACLPDEYD